MSKNKIITSLVIGAALFSFLAAFLIYSYLTPTRSTVYVFNDSYSAGTELKSSMLTPVQVDSTIVVAGKSTDIGDQFVTPEEYQSLIRSGDSLRMDVSEGMPLTSSMLSVSGGSSIEMNMKSDSIAVTIEVNRYTGVTNDLKEGSRVNIYSNMDGKVTLIQQNKRVLEVFKSSGTISGVAIEENISESMELIYAVTNGSIYLGLVDATGYQSSEGSDPSYSPYLSTDEYVLEDETQTETEPVETEAAETEPESMEETEPITTEATEAADGAAVFTP